MWRIIGIISGILLAIAICLSFHVVSGLATFCFGASLVGFGQLLGAIADK